MREETIYDTLKTYFNYEAFKVGQLEIIEDVLAGRDVLGVLGTGSGKSLCYQLPAKLLSGVTIVVSPLISLMIDQVREVKAFHYKEVVALHSFQSFDERKKVLGNLHEYKLIYVSPELLQQWNVIQQLKKVQVSLFVIDEAHCISQWGPDFRPDYLRLKETLQELNHPPFLALTGTATPEVQDDIPRYLGRDHVKKHIYPMDRNNISILVEQVANENEKLSRVREVVQSHDVPTIIYFLSRKATKEIADILKRKLPERQIAFYHGGMSKQDRLKIQQQFMNDQIDIICSTSAFGMGINKVNVRLVIHFHMPTQLESFIQEIGRAGRDGKPSVSMLLHERYDITRPLHIIENELPTEAALRVLFNQIYILYKAGQTLPEKESEITELFGIEETKWRYVQYHLEQAGVMIDGQFTPDLKEWEKALSSIQAFTEKRVEMKHDKVQDMENWLTTDRCLREALFEGFQERTQRKMTQCCSNCGFSFSEWEINPVVSHIIKHENWENKLQGLLLGETK